MHWIKVAGSLKRKPQFQRLCDLTAESANEIQGRLLDLWHWVAEESVDGTLAGLGLAACVRIAGGSEDFWSAVVSVGWLIVSPEGLSVPRFERWFGGRAGERKSGNAARCRRAREKKRQLGASQGASDPMSRRASETVSRRASRHVESESESESDSELNTNQSAQLTLAPAEGTEGTDLRFAEGSDQDFGHEDQETVEKAFQAAPEASVEDKATSEPTPAEAHLQTPTVEVAPQVEPSEGSEGAAPGASDPMSRRASRHAPHVAPVAPTGDAPTMSRRADLDPAKLEEGARTLFRLLHYHGDDGRLLWLAAALPYVGASWMAVVAAAEATGHGKRHSPVGYFRKLLSDKLGPRAETMLAAAEDLVPRHLHGPPPRFGQAAPPPHLARASPEPPPKGQTWADDGRPATLAEILKLRSG